MNGQDGVARVVGVVEEGPQLGFPEVALETADGRGDVAVDALAFGGELGKNLELLLEPLDALEELKVLLQELLFLLERLRGLLVLPDLRRGETGVYLLELGGLLIEVKENLGPPRLSRRGRGASIRGPAFWRRQVS
jgi:hypothetical protein